MLHFLTQRQPFLSSMLEEFCQFHSASTGLGKAVMISWDLLFSFCLDFVFSHLWSLWWQECFGDRVSPVEVCWPQTCSLCKEANLQQLLGLICYSLQFQMLEYGLKIFSFSKLSNQSGSCTCSGPSACIPGPKMQRIAAGSVKTLLLQKIFDSVTCFTNIVWEVTVKTWNSINNKLASAWLAVKLLKIRFSQFCLNAFPKATIDCRTSFVLNRHEGVLRRCSMAVDTSPSPGSKVVISFCWDHQHFWPRPTAVIQTFLNCWNFGAPPPWPPLNCQTAWLHNLRKCPRTNCWLSRRGPLGFPLCCNLLTHWTNLSQTHCLL